MQIGVQLGEFRNIDLFKQGVYQLRVALYHLSHDGSKVFLLMLYRFT